MGGGGLRERPHTEKMGGFQSGPSLKIEGVLELKITKKRMFLKGGSFVWSSPDRKSGTNKCIFLKREVFRCGPGRKGGVFRSRPGRKNAGLFGGTYPHCPNMGVPRPLPPGQTETERKTKENSLINYLCLTDRQTDRQAHRHKREKWSKTH